MDKLSVDKVLKVLNLANELEFERAVSLYNKLRWMMKEDETLKSIRTHLKNLINRYEEINLGNNNKFTDKQINESDEAELIVENENLFVQKRKEIILRKLKSFELKQQDLGKILGHRKNYMSELINGVRPFSKNDLVVINQLLKISWKQLIPPFIDNEVQKHINLTLEELNRPKLRLPNKNRDLAKV